MRNDLAHQHHERRTHNVHGACNASGAGGSSDTHCNFGSRHNDIRFRNDNHRAECQHYDFAHDGQCGRGRDSGIYGDSYRNEQYERHLDAHAKRRALYARMRHDRADKHGQWRTCNLHGANDDAG